MTNPSYTAIGVVVDRSGSMMSIKSDAEGAIKAFVEEQAKQPGHATIRLAEFDTVYSDVYKSTDIYSAPEYVLQPRGGTALNDAIGRFVTEFGEELAALPEAQRPGKVIVVIVTDGFENSSNEWSAPEVKELVEKQQGVYSWDFVFLAANQDATLTGKDYGFAAGSSITFAAGEKGLANVTSALNSYVTSTRSGLAYNFSDEERAAAKQS